MLNRLINKLKSKSAHLVVLGDLNNPSLLHTLKNVKRVVKTFITSMNVHLYIVENKVLLFASTVDENQSDLEFFLRNSNGKPSAEWFLGKRHNNYKLGYFNISRGNIVLRNSNFDQIFEDWVAYDIKLESSYGSNIGQVVFKDLTIRKLKIMEETSNGIELKQKLENLFSDVMKEIVQDPDKRKARSVLIPMLNIYRQNMCVK